MNYLQAGQLIIVENFNDESKKTYLVVNQDTSVPEIVDVFSVEDNCQRKIFVYEVMKLATKKQNLYHSKQGAKIKYTLI